ncbi:MAG: DUF2961 domain-containing protein [Marinilabiliaceae bacterium]|jgi:hypothetical protein|nr:DUF2961 domain-containing protein [Marinilabiliaceae bacterium]
MKNIFIPAFSFLLVVSCTNVEYTAEVNTGTLLQELTDLSRLTLAPSEEYSLHQFSSYDRRSSHPYSPGWFQNSDGFGGEPRPGFQEILSEPDSTGTGEYLICDIKGPGAIVRTWTARMNGVIKLRLDGEKTAFWEGPAEDFLWKMAGALNGDTTGYYEGIFRQNDASYFPLAFSEGCRIEWKGELENLHFYHIEIRRYKPGMKVRSFSIDDFTTYSSIIEEIESRFSGLETIKQSGLDKSLTVAAGGSDTLYLLNGPGVITDFIVRVNNNHAGNVLRESVLKIFFDGASVPQLMSPLGDFFGAAPGINPYGSLPFTVSDDGTMECRFHMPFKSSAVVILENRGKSDINLDAGLEVSDYKWVDGSSMHFRAKWRINRGLTASNRDIIDIPYLLAMGKGRFVGTSAFLKNPSQVPTSWGNWWGEGDEKIFVDNPAEPVFIGTGSEDYFNYSWSSASLFDYAYCGQPRNDGPANRGFVTNYRFHISDDIPFEQSFTFYMELLHHGVVQNFDYARIVYYYSLPSAIDDCTFISESDLEKQEMPVWEHPQAYLGSANAVFVEAEDIISVYPLDRLRYNYLWSGGRAVFYDFSRQGDKVYFNLRVPEEGEYTLTMVIAHMPGSGLVKVYLEDDPGSTASEFNLAGKYNTYSRNHSLGRVLLSKGRNRIVVENLEREASTLGVDFLWYK